MMTKFHGANFSADRFTDRIRFDDAGVRERSR
jgi:hypothetical protein